MNFLNLFLLLSTTVGIVAAKSCTSSRDCDHLGAKANCCNGHCSDSWSTACEEKGCAAGETYVQLPITSSSNRCCLNNTDPCSTSELCQVKNACRNVPGTQTAQFTCASCPAGMHGNWCDRCSTSEACNFGTAANCCNGTCQPYWSSDCENGGCAAGETYINLPITSYSSRRCLNNTDPCSAPKLCQVKDACRNVPGTQTAQFTCASCPAGMHGSWCDRCSSSEACNYGNAANCCNGTCQVSWSSECENGGCAAGETYVHLPDTSNAARWCLNNTDPCSTPELCQVKNACRNVPGTQTAQFTCASCPAGRNGSWCERCSTSDVCNLGPAANCCNGTCHTSWSTACQQKGCAAGETYVHLPDTSDSDRSCLNSTDPCSTSGLCQVKNACRNVPGTQAAQFTCASCPSGFHGEHCERCSTSDACSSGGGTSANCCNGTCHTSWSSACASGKACAKGETWIPMNKDSDSQRWCLNTTDPCRGAPDLCAIPGACRSDETDNGEYHCATCPTGLYGAKCTDCTTSAACPENCCSGKCYSNYSPVCTSGNHCAQGEHWNPNATGRKCVKNSIRLP